jgi:hypothetical protein
MTGSGKTRTSLQAVFRATSLCLFLSVALLVGCAHAPSNTSSSSPTVLSNADQPQGSGKKVFAHYFPPYPLSKDNAPADDDYYTREYLDPWGENGKHAAYGGFFRNRPLPVAVGDPQRWRLDNMKTEILRASAAGIDGFLVDILSIETFDWEQVQRALTAAAELGNGFTIMPMPDGDVLDVTPRQLAAAMASLADSPAITRLSNGRLAISAFAPEKRGVTFWREFLRLMREEHGEDVAFVPCFLDYGKSATAFEEISYGFGNWGARSPLGNTKMIQPIDDAHARGKIWMQPVSAQDVRPSQGVFDEANNTENLRMTWEAAVRDADWVQLITWNDYAEGTEFSPSAHTGWSLLDISCYYLSMFKLGHPPEVTRDVLHISHRTQFVAARPTHQQELTRLRDGSSPARDRVEVLAFLTQPASIRLIIGREAYVFDAPSGVNAFTAPLSAGMVSAELRRGDSTTLLVASPFVVRSDVAVQDLQYHFVSTDRRDPAAPHRPAYLPAGG